MKIRDKETFVLFVLGIGLSFFIVINGIHLLNAWFTQLLRGQEESGYQYSVVLEIQRDHSEIEGESDIESMAEDSRIQYEKAGQLLELLTKQDKTTYIKELYLPIGNASVKEPVNVILSGSEEWYRTLQSGQYPASMEWQMSGKMAVINETARTYVEVIQGQEVIKINGENYQVIGIFENYQISDAEVEISIFYKPEPGDAVQMALMEAFQWGFERKICIGSQDEEVEDIAKFLMTEIEESTGYLVSISEDQIDLGASTFYARIKGLILGILFLVSLMNCWQITRLWITRKQKDLVIFKTFGFSDRQILIQVLGELAQMVMITMIMVACLDVGYILLFQSGHTDWGIVLRNSGFLLVAFLVIMAVTVMPVIKNIRELIPAQGLREE